MAAKINFFNEDLSYTVKQKGELRKWILGTIRQEGYSCGDLTFILCSDAYLLDMNIKYLNHNTLTDVITFDNSETEGLIEGDIFISIERVAENAKLFNVSTENELHRVFIHGVLHLLGYEDKGEENKARMTLKEDQYLALRSFV